MNLLEYLHLYWFIWIFFSYLTFRFFSICFSLVSAQVEGNLVAFSTVYIAKGLFALIWFRSYPFSSPAKVPTPTPIVNRPDTHSMYIVHKLPVMCDTKSLYRAMQKCQVLQLVVLHWQCTKPVAVLSCHPNVEKARIIGTHTWTLSFFYFDIR